MTFNSTFILTSSFDGEDETAELSILVNGTSVTRMYDTETKSIRDWFRAPFLPLAFFLADNWWRLNFEPLPINRVPDSEWRLRHDLSSISASIQWPPLMIHGTGRRVVIEQAYGVPSLPAPSIYVPSPTAEIDCSSFASGVDTFLHRASAESNRTGSSGLATLLRDLQAERDDKEISSWRKLEAILGFDADRAPDELIERLASYNMNLAWASP